MSSSFLWLLGISRANKRILQLMVDSLLLAVVFVISTGLWL